MNKSGNCLAITQRVSDLPSMGVFSLLLLLFSLLLSTNLYAVEEESTLSVQLVDGTQDNMPMINTVIKIQELRADGSKKWHKQLTTDNAGNASSSISFTEGSTCVLSVRSSFNNKYKRLNLDVCSGTHTFTVGTPLLAVTLRDIETSKTFADTNIRAYQVVSGEKDKYLAQAKTDAEGVAKFDLPLLAEGSSIRLRADKVYNKIYSYSPIITQAGVIDFALATTRIALLDGRNDQPIANQEVRIYTIEADGKQKWYDKAFSDEQGILRLSLKGMTADGASSSTYVLKTRSPFNNKYKTSQEISTAGDVSFYVGDPLLRTIVKDASNNDAIIPNLEVSAYQILNGKPKQFAKATTDAEGVVEFDVPDLAEDGSDTVVVLSTKWQNGKMREWSEEITSLGQHDFMLASTVVTLKDGSIANGEMLANHAVNLREVIGEGKTKSIANLTTDAQGKVRFGRAKLADDVEYMLCAKNPHPIIKKNKCSPIIAMTGEHEFLVGTQLLNVRLMDAINATVIANKQVTVYMEESDSRKYLAKATTDADGMAMFDIPQLAEEDNNDTFILKANKPYGIAHVDSMPFSNGIFSVDFPVGKDQVILSNKDTGAVLANQTIFAYEIIDGTLKRHATGKSDDTGIVHFDLANLNAAQPHIFYVKNPFGNNKKYYSEQTTSHGTVNFAISPDADASLDLDAPEVAITTPTAGSQVGETGFELVGTATDNTAVDSVSVAITQAGATTQHTAAYDSATSQWRLSITAAQISGIGELSIQVNASDEASNQGNISATYSVIADANAPVLSISSPSADSSVPVTGFILQGTATDDTGIASLSAQVQDSGASSPVVPRDITVNSDGNWSLAINNGELSLDNTVSITLTLSDISGKQTTQTVSFTVAAASNEARHLINRITFGATPELLEEVRNNGVNAYLNSQLAPETIDDSALNALLTEPFSREELQRYQLTHMIHSRRQLKEVMAWFWENHFNTDVNKEGNDFSYELAEHNQFRTNALGNFRDLLEISAKSPAMLIYLDSILNTSSDANENYAREVMELSTCGVDACYGEEDVEALAEIFTGWQVRNDAFFFNASEHTAGSKVFLGTTIAEGGVSEGNTALDMLANHTATAQYICSKLIKVFVNDNVDASLNSRCASTFNAAHADSDQITQVLRLLLTSPEFNSESNFNSKVKTPVEFAVGVVRALNAQGNYDNLAGYIQRMGINLFRNPIPTGWDEEGNTWINSALLQERTRFVNQIAMASSGSTFITPINFFQARNLNTADAIVSYLFDLLGGNIWSDLERQIALEILNANGIPFDINAPNAESQLREVIGTIQSYPEYNYQ